jgi:hypothetical protein
MVIETDKGDEMNHLQESLERNLSLLRSRYQRSGPQHASRDRDQNGDRRRPGARFVDIPMTAHGIDELCGWVETVHRECGTTTLDLHRYFENGCELMAKGTMQIERLPRII